MFLETHLKDNLFLREFSEKSIMQWHKDLEDRIIYCLSPTDWKFQYDNKLPIEIKENTQYFIPKNTFHRLISDNKHKLILYIYKMK